MESVSVFSATTSTLHSEARNKHDTISADRWCITKADLRQFRSDVMAAWIIGDIPQDIANYDPCYDDPRIGPSLYQVNKYFVQPLTKKAGGVSYALMKHPNGSPPCDLFVTHAWAEGVFEFVDKVLQAWPFGKRHLWCCLLALPQNLDLGRYINVPLERTPFGLAMQSATHVIVVPNGQVSIYTRLWCVYEAFLAVEGDKTLALPVHISWLSKRGAGVLLRTVVVPSLFGYVIGCLIWLYIFMDDDNNTDADQVDKDEGSLIDIFARGTLVLCVIMLSMPTVCKCQLRRGVLMASHVIMLSTIPVLEVLWDQGQLASGPNGAWKRVIMLAVALTRYLVVLMDTHRWLEEDERWAMSHQIAHNFESVHKAQCQDPDDQARIMEAIAGREDQVDEVVHVLMEAGTYTEDLRKARSRGVNIRGLGSTSYAKTALLSAMFWAIAGTFIAERAEKWAEQVARGVGFVSLSTCVVCFVALVAIATSKRFRPMRSIRAHLLVRALSWSAVFTVLIVFSVLGVPHIVQARNRHSFSDRLQVYGDSHPPPSWMANAALLSCPFWVLASVAWTCSSWTCRHRASAEDGRSQRQCGPQDAENGLTSFAADVQTSPADGSLQGMEQQQQQPQQQQQQQQQQEQEQEQAQEEHKNGAKCVVHVSYESADPAGDDGE